MLLCSTKITTPTSNFGIKDIYDLSNEVSSAGIVVLCRCAMRSHALSSSHRPRTSETISASVARVFVQHDLNQCRPLSDTGSRITGSLTINVVPLPSSPTFLTASPALVALIMGGTYSIRNNFAHTLLSSPLPGYSTPIFAWPIKQPQ